MPGFQIVRVRHPHLVGEATFHYWATHCIGPNYHLLFPTLGSRQHFITERHIWPNYHLLFPTLFNGMLQLNPTPRLAPMWSKSDSRKFGHCLPKIYLQPKKISWYVSSNIISIIIQSIISTYGLRCKEQSHPHRTLSAFPAKIQLLTSLGSEGYPKESLLLQSPTKNEYQEFGLSYESVSSSQRPMCMVDPSYIYSVHVHLMI